MKRTITIILACLALALAGCNVGVTEKADGGAGGTGNDTGAGPKEDGGATDSGGEPVDGGGGDEDGGVACPAIEPMYPCEKQDDCPSGYECVPMFDDMPWCGSACVLVGLDAGTGDGGYPDVPMPCIHLCDCPQGWVCDNGTCFDLGDVVGTVFCCDNPGCPMSAPCEHRDNSYDRCPGDVDAGYPDGGHPDAGQCIGEGESINRTGDPNPPPCCPGLEPIPLMAFDPAGGCAVPSCDCVVCVKKCGDMQCTTGENPCNCPQDCPASIAGGPGSKCLSDNDCTGGASCLPEKSGYPEGGYCAGPACDMSWGSSQCPAGSICLPMEFSQAMGLCMQACSSDHDCRQGLTCEATPVSQLYMGTPYFCWQSGAGGLGGGLGEACTGWDDCITRDCEAVGAGGVKVCTQYCFAEQACKAEQICVSSPNCGDPPPACGMCIYPVK
jgi:hypothetical protein